MSTATVPPAEALAALSIVADGDAYVVGDPRTRTFVAVPAVGAHVLEWLRAGDDVVTAARRAEELVGEPVDVADFLGVLVEQGVLTHQAPAAPSGVSPRWQRLGAAVFGRTGWSVQLALTALGVVLAVRDPSLRPRGSHLVVAGSPLASLLVGMAAAVLCTVLHEGGHVLAAAARGVPTRLSVGRRLWFLTAQADLTGLWTLPRLQRLPPLLAGLSVDAAVTGGLVAVEASGVCGGTAAEVLRATVALQLAAMVFQGAVFLRTDLYAVLATLSGCRTLWALKSALLRQAVGRAGASDLEVLAAAGRRERAWARAYLLLYVPGTLAATWYLAAVSLPGTAHVVRLTGDGLAPLDLGSGRTWQSLAVVSLVVVPNLLTVGAALAAQLRSAGRLRRADEVDPAAVQD
ncbi:hypothetical protein CLV35_2564 [Motilibacter peucedani]|uniref:Peptide zinc metalloprotease protein n=1 Tax=Motilibacter peucedani TaxID=598650 RepID=A0A420XPF6_9ACTN|nr:hypothetical protein [Motilibacter peucedani]RKS74065.1 hypothetical protein CLV35_2564 [Motilibacter peucedani]